MPAFKLNEPGKQQIVGEEKQEGCQSYHCHHSERGMFLKNATNKNTSISLVGDSCSFISEFQKSHFYTLGTYFSLSVAFGKYTAFSVVGIRNWGSYLLSFSTKIQGATCTIIKALNGVQRIHDATSLE